VVSIPTVPTTTSPPVDEGPTSEDVGSEPAVVADLSAPLPRLAGGVELGEPSVVRYAGVPLTDVAISPSGRWIASNRGTEICLIETAVGTTDPDDGCADYAEGVADRTMSWSPDESSIAFHHDIFRRQTEPDIVVLDTASLEYELITDDGSDEVRLGLVDLAPFFDDAGNLYFFRMDDGPPARLMSVVDDLVTPVDDIQVAPFAVRAVRDESTGRIAILVPESAGTTTIDLLDLTERSLTPTPVGDSVALDISDVRSSKALVVPVGPPDIAIGALVDLDRPAPTQLLPRTVDAERAVTGVGLAPDGSAVVMIIEDRSDPAGHQLVVAPVLDDGSIGSPGVLASGLEFAPNDGDRTIRPQGLGTRNEIVWLDDRMIYGLGPDRIVTLAISTGL
jgi:hypothetical protein